MRKVLALLDEILMVDLTRGPYIIIFFILIGGGFMSILSCPYLWHNILLYIIMPFLMLFLSKIISRSFNKKVSIIGMIFANILVILYSFKYFVEMREAWDKWDEPDIIEYFISDKLYYFWAMLFFMLLSMFYASRFIIKCPKCGEWNPEIIKTKTLGSYRTTVKYRNDKKIYNNTGEQIGSIENYDSELATRSYGQTTYKCMGCKHSWNEEWQH